MSEQKKTVSFVCAAGVTLLLAAFTHFMTQPAESTDFEMVGKEFYEDFQGSSQATSLEVLAIDPDSAELKQFRVEEKDGVWTIPSHFGYPAEASDRLARTSSSLIGTTRETLVGHLKADHERFGVVDPLSEDNLDPESAGKRITIKDESGEVLVDLIIGHEAEKLDASESQLAFGQEATATDYYVRRPDEVQTYKVAMELDLSTKFSDWIRPDLLDLEGAELRRIVIDNYELAEQADPLGRVTNLFKKQGDQMLFSRETGFGPWNLDGQDDEKGTLNSTKIDTAVSTLDNLKIVGVRKKTNYKDQPLLNADLTINQIDDLKQNIPLFRQIMGQFQNELANNGFNLAPVAQNSEELTIVSTAGEMSAGTGDGVLYTLQFGNPVSGDDDEIEIGTKTTDLENANDDQGKSDESETTEQSMPVVDGENTDAEAEKEDIQNRFLMIRVSFDESLIGEKPVAPEKPEEPVKPEGYVPAPEQTESADADSEASDKAPAPEGEGSDNQNDNTDSAEETDNEVDDRPDEFKDYDLLMTEYEQKKTEFELKLAQFDDESKEFEMNVNSGKELVSELDERFGAWYYVISADNLESLQLTREDLVTEKDPPQEDPAGDPAEDPGLPTPPNIKLDDEIMQNESDNVNAGLDDQQSDSNVDPRNNSDDANSEDESSENEGKDEGGGAIPAA